MIDNTNLIPGKTISSYGDLLMQHISTAISEITSTVRNTTHEHPVEDMTKGVIEGCTKHMDIISIRKAFCAIIIRSHVIMLNTSEELFKLRNDNMSVTIKCILRHIILEHIPLNILISKSGYSQDTRFPESVCTSTNEEPIEWIYRKLSCSYFELQTAMLQYSNVVNLSLEEEIQHISYLPLDEFEIFIMEHSDHAQHNHHAVFKQTDLVFVKSIFKYHIQSAHRHTIEEEMISPIQKDRVLYILQDILCRSAIHLSLSETSMGLSKILILHFIDSTLRLCNANVYQYSKTCSRKAIDQPADITDKDVFGCSYKLSGAQITIDEAAEGEERISAIISERLAELCPDSNQIDDKHSKVCSHSVQHDNHTSANFDHSLADQRTTEIPSFDFNETANRSMVSLSKPQKPHSDQPDDPNDHIQILRELTWLPHDELPVPEIDITVANVLDPIFRDMSSGTTPGPRVTMKYELLRLCTLRNYPKTNKPYIIRLAGAGFYYAADGDEVICYCCGIRRRNWTEECKPIRIHRRLSPNCSFLTKNAEVNIPVPPASAEELTRFALLKELIKDEESSDSALGNDSSMSTRQTGNQQQRQGGIAHQPTVTSEGQNQNSQARDVPQQPKHPHYGVLNTRVGSFQGFPDGNGQDPAVLADAGFYYVGFEDCVRCFQCGVGLRHWAAEDDPWIEHCRWTLATPCPYLVRKKGEEFVSLVRMAIEITQNEPNSQSLQEDTVSHEENSVQATESSADNNAERDDTAPSVDRSGEKTPGSRAGDQRPDKNNTAGEREPMLTADRTGDKTSGSKAGNNSNGQKSATNSRTNVRKPHSDIKKDTSKTSPTKVVKGKESLSDEQRRLIAENARLRDQTICRVCCQRGVCIVFLPCGHLVTCDICAPSVRTCPICNSKVKGTVKTFMS